MVKIGLIESLSREQGLKDDKMFGHIMSTGLTGILTFTLGEYADQEMIERLTREEEERKIRINSSDVSEQARTQEYALEAICR